MNLGRSLKAGATAYRRICDRKKSSLLADDFAPDKEFMRVREVGFLGGNRGQSGEEEIFTRRIQFSRQPIF